VEDRPSGSDVAAAFSPPTVEEARDAGVLILVAEDNATNQLVIRRMLSQRGYAAEIVDNGAEALRKVEANPLYGLLLTDFHMPEMDGFTLTAKIREREAGGQTRLPIVALTADALPGTERRCLEAGMDGYLTKPIDSKLLTAVLAQWLPGAAALRRTGGQTAKTSAAIEIDPQIFDVARLTETFGAVTPEALAFVADFVAGARALSAAVTAAMDAQDWAEARHHAHALKGAAGSAGAVRLSQLASEVQDGLDSGDPDTASLFVGGLETTVEELAQCVEPLLKRATR
jgi:CheY-like chemotaxis protein/HPt (histidine-containing phosphotransfer) domain-containing protein